MLKPTNEVLGDIDKIRKRFLWAGDEDLTGGSVRLIGQGQPCQKSMAALGYLTLTNSPRLFD
jgi:hypothetical protein